MTKPHSLYKIATAALVAVLAATPARAEPAADAWFAAARDGDTATLRKLAGTRPAEHVDAVNPSGYTALILASYHARRETVTWLLENKASTCRTDARGYTALMGAVFRGHDPIVEALARRPCGADHVTAAGQTPLMLAALFGRTASTRLLLAAGADPTRKDNAGTDARSLALAQGHDEVVAILARASIARK